MHQFQILGGAPALPLAALFDQVACIDALNYHRKLQILFCNKLTKLAKWQQLCLQLSHRPSLSNDRKGSNKDRKGLIGENRLCFSTTLLARTEASVSPESGTADRWKCDYKNV